MNRRAATFPYYGVFHLIETLDPLVEGSSIEPSRRARLSAATVDDGHPTLFVAANLSGYSGTEMPPGTEKPPTVSASARVPAMISAVQELGSDIAPRIEIQPFGTYRVAKEVLHPGIQDGIKTISEADYDKLNETWLALQNGTGNVRFDPDLTAWQRSKLLQAFATLLGRSVGGALTRYAVWDGVPMCISADTGSQYRRDQTLSGQGRDGVPRSQIVTVPLYRDLRPLYRTVDGTFALLKLSDALGHELGHGTTEHALERRHTPDFEYENLDERIVAINWENPLHAEGNTPLRRSHEAAYHIQIPLPETERALLHSIAQKSGSVSSSKSVLQLIKKLVALSNDPEISPQGRKLCARGATQLLARSDLSQFKTEVLPELGKDLAIVYADLARGLPYRGAAMPDFQRASLNEMVQELQRLGRAPADLIRTDVQDEYARLWNALDSVIELSDALTMDLGLLLGHFAGAKFEPISLPENQRKPL